MADKQFDFAGLTNPKRVLARREAAAEGESMSHEAAEPTRSGGRFGKPFSAEDRAKHQAALAKKLRGQ